LTVSTTTKGTFRETYGGLHQKNNLTTEENEGTTLSLNEETMTDTPHTQGVREKLERLEMDDQDSKGCSVTLGEWLSKSNIDYLEEFIAAQRKEAVLEVLERIEEAVTRGKGDWKVAPYEIETIRKETNQS
jgi:hypothetical protein